MLFLASLSAVVFLNDSFCLVDMDIDDKMMIHQQCLIRR
jgi:hypothetical protein